MSRFNLIDEAWIPVCYLNGECARLGIRDTLLESSRITAIEDHSPLVAAALHRFLLAVLYRSLEGPTDIDEARRLFRHGLPLEQITAYLEKWRSRFWLFDDTYPFGQIPTFEPRNWRAWTVLAAEHNADNAKVLFDHVDIGAAGAIAPDVAVRWMLATQTFSVSSANSELAYTGTAPSATAALVLPVGQNLQDTLLFLLVPQNREISRLDTAVWEREPETIETLKRGPARVACGLADRYTWPVRSIRLDSEASGQITRIGFASGVGFEAADQTDPMVGYRMSDKAGRLPLIFRDRGIWRDFDALLPDSTRLAPQVIDHARRLSEAHFERFPRAIFVLGQSNDKAKINFWRMERFAFPEALAGDKDVRTEIATLLKDAENTQEALYKACSTYARHVLGRGERMPAPKDIKNFVAQMPASNWFWSGMEARFQALLMNYTLERDSEDIRCEWLTDVRRVVSVAWEKHSAMVKGGDAWGIRALIKAENILQRKLKELNDEIEKLKPEEEDL